MLKHNEPELLAEYKILFACPNWQRSVYVFKKVAKVFVS